MARSNNTEDLQNNEIPGEEKIASLKPAKELNPENKIIQSIIVEKIIITKKPDSEKLKISFNIKNISKKDKNITGRIFVKLNPDNPTDETSIITPPVGIKAGIPSRYYKGQYFSITRFKGVNLSIINKQKDTDYYKTCTVFIYNLKGKLIEKKDFDIKIESIIIPPAKPDELIESNNINENSIEQNENSIEQNENKKPEKTTVIKTELNVDSNTELNTNIEKKILKVQKTMSINNKL